MNNLQNPPEITDIYQNSFSRKTRNGYEGGGWSRGLVDGIQTHCGYIEPLRIRDDGLDAHGIARGCDNFFKDRGMVWSPEKQEYFIPGKLQ